MKRSDTPPSGRRPVTGLTAKTPLQLLHEAWQGGWIEAPQVTETLHPLWPQSFWTVVVSVAHFPPGVAVGPKRADARRLAADRVMRHIRPVLNVCPPTGRDVYPSRKTAQDAVDRQQMLGRGKPLTRVFRCTLCDGWHVSGSRTAKLKRKLRKGRTRSGAPWNARVRAHEIMTTSEGERVAVVMAELGLNAPQECMGQPVAVSMNRTLLAGLLQALDEEDN